MDISDRCHDVELVKKARSGDDAAMSELLAIAMPIASAKAHLAASKGCPVLPDDLIQEGMLGFLSAVENYSDDPTASFKTYVDVCIGNRIATAIERERRRQSAMADASPDDEKSEAGRMIDTNFDVFTKVSVREKVRLLESILDGQGAFTDIERAVLYGRVSGRSYEEIAAECSATVKAVDNAYQRAKKKLKELFDLFDD